MTFFLYFQGKRQEKLFYKKVSPVTLSKNFIIYNLFLIIRDIHMKSFCGGLGEVLFSKSASSNLFSEHSVDRADKRFDGRKHDIAVDTGTPRRTLCVLD